MNVIECINKRRSIRSFKDEQVPLEVVQELLVLGTKAATGSFEQPWGFVIIQDRDQIETMADRIKRNLLENLDKTPHLARYEDMLKNEKFNVFNHAPTLIIIYGNTESRWYVNDCSMAAGNIMLAARSMDIGTCWIGFAHHYLNSADFKEEHGVPEGFDLVAPLTCGYMKSEGVERQRKAPVVFNA